MRVIIAFVTRSGTLVGPGSMVKYSNEDRSKSVIPLFIIKE
ncbi:MAG: hypothetical protein OXF28_02265 [Thaumarchaeota archaeon]|nr:hypothetical protein [Nitrososphaerota archaeon]MCY3975941.1 hypothetical protein [Nitrososphaerota archaeon]